MTAISVMGGSNGTFLHHFLASQNKANTSDNEFVRVVLPVTYCRTNNTYNPNELSSVPCLSRYSSLEAENCSSSL